MRTKVFFKTIALSVVILFGSLSASAVLKNNLVYNSEEKDGVMISQTIYKMESGSLTNHVKHNYKYDEQKRMTENETLKWNNAKESWENDLRVCYNYQGKNITTTYYKWNSKKKSYVLLPEMTMTMDNSR